MLLCCMDQLFCSDPAVPLHIQVGKKSTGTVFVCPWMFVGQIRGNLKQMVKAEEFSLSLSCLL